MTPNRRTFLLQLGLGTAGAGLVAPAFGYQVKPSTPTSNRLPRATPESQGVSSAGVLAFLDGVAASQNELHSFMMVRHGHVIAEGWWAPYAATLNHTMYSMSKSFTSTAVGLAVMEKRLTVEDKVISFFPDDLPAQVSENLAALRVKDLLTMASGHDKDPTGEVVKSENWVRAFLASKLDHAPGTNFVYNSVATYMCSAIVQKITGHRVVDFLQPRLFAPLGIEGMTWETCPRGINTGGWGLNIRTEGLAKFGELYLKKGAWHGRRILSEEWVAEATTFKIQQPLAAKPARPKETDDWKQGYCYQFWRCTHNAVRGDGAFGQFTVMLPEQDAVIVMTGESKDLQGELDLVWTHLLPAMQPKPLAPDTKVAGALKRRLASLSLPPVKGAKTSPVAAQTHRKEFQVGENSLGITKVTFNFMKRGCLLEFRTSQGTHPLWADFGGWRAGTTALPGTPPRIIAGSVPGGLKRLPIVTSAAWRDEQTLELMLRFIETPHHDRITCEFAGNGVKISFLNSIIGKRANAKDSRPVLEGKLV
ncbi:MAG: serine hydrolase [Verrucomicrobia bacterium]|nr:serine hydrolase [Verrucomicrobiota bacterium]